MEKILYVELENGILVTDEFVVKKETGGTVETRNKNGDKRKFFKSGLEKNKENYIIDPIDIKESKTNFLISKKEKHELIIKQIENEIKGLLWIIVQTP